MTQLEQLQHYLHPSRFPGMSGKMVAIVAYVLDLTDDLTDPAIDDMIITSDDCVLAQHVGDVGYNDFIGANSDFQRNVSELLEVTPEIEGELKEFAERRFAEKVHKHDATTFATE